MTEFLADFSEHAFLRYAFFTGVLASVACGVVGSYVVTRRITTSGRDRPQRAGRHGGGPVLPVVYGWSWFHRSWAQ